MNANVVLKRLRKQDDDESEARPSALLPEDWRQMDRLVRAAVKDTSAETSQKLSQTLHQLQVQNELLHHENSGLRDALTANPVWGYSILLVPGEEVMAALEDDEGWNSPTLRH
jgi:hypothetical protein